ncbi:MAG: DUF362 domain-containing protein [Verrucomicrobiota bacterium]
MRPPSTMHRNLTFLFISTWLCLLFAPSSICGQSVRPGDFHVGGGKIEQDPEKSPPVTKTGFVLVHAPGAISRFKANPSQVAHAFNTGLVKWSGKSSVPDAWKTLVKPGDRIGLRISTTGGSITSTHPSLVQTIVDGLKQAGIQPKDIIVWDKNPHHMMSAGYVPMQPDNQWQCKSTVEGSGWDPEVFYFQETVGRLIWGDHEFKGTVLPIIPPEGSVAAEDAPEAREQISNRSYFSKILTQEVDKVINLPTMTTHPGVGLQGCLSSLALGSIDNHRRFLDGTESSAQAIAEILQKEVIAEKTILHVMDGLIMQYAGGPAFDPNHAYSAGFILIGQDPVAIDSWCLQQIEYRREDTSVVAIGKKADHIKAAKAYGLGQHFQESLMTEVKLAP